VIALMGLVAALLSASSDGDLEATHGMSACIVARTGSLLIL
jgi:hypothetical protein